MVFPFVVVLGFGSFGATFSVAVRLGARAQSGVPGVFAGSVSFLVASRLVLTARGGCGDESVVLVVAPLVVVEGASEEGCSAAQSQHRVCAKTGDARDQWA